MEEEEEGGWINKVQIVFAGANVNLCESQSARRCCQHFAIQAASVADVGETGGWYGIGGGACLLSVCLALGSR